MLLPTGTLTFLFSDIVASTRLWEDEPDAMRAALAHHDTVLSETIESASGSVVKRTGDGFHAVFDDASCAIAAAVAIQRICHTTNWPTGEPIRVRIGLHTGESQLRDDDYYGPTVNRAARLMAAAHGGQIVCSASTGELAREGLDEHIRFIDLGEHRLRDLARAEQVLQIEHSALPWKFPPLRSIDTLPGNLPTQPNRFLGRHDLITSLTAQLRESRVVTIAGIGGAGKTRLALQLAATVQPELRDGAWFVDLSAVNDPELVAAEIFETLDYSPADGENPVDGLCKRLRRRQSLLLLDNCEQVIEGVARIAHAIATTTEVRLLITSREGLGIAAEQLVPIPPLDTSPDGEAVQMFVSRAQSVRPNFVLDENNRRAVTDLCRCLDGIPLAIELAAARSRTLSPSQILERIDQRFRLLKSGDRTAAARHQTLQAAVDWSYDLLGPQQQTVLNRLAVFTGEFSLDAAEAIVSDSNIDPFEVLDSLDALVDKSLIVAEDTPRGRRYRLLETIRQYAGERLSQSGETDTLRQRHAGYYQMRVKAIVPSLFGAGEIDAFDELDADLDNLRAMLDWYLDRGDAAVAIDLIDKLQHYIRVRDHNLWVKPRLERCLNTTLDDADLAVALSVRARIKSHAGHAGIPTDTTSARSAAERAGIPLPLATFFADAVYPIYQGDMPAAAERFSAAIDVARARNNTAVLCHALVARLMTYSLANQNDPTLREQAALLGKELNALTNSPSVRMEYLRCVGLTHLSVDPMAARQFFSESLQLAQTLGCKSFAADSGFFVGLTCFYLGDGAQAVRYWRDALATFHEIGYLHGELRTLGALAGVALKYGYHKEALTLMAGLCHARSALQLPGSDWEQAAEARIGDFLTKTFGEHALDNAENAGLEAIVDNTLALLERFEHNPVPMTRAPKETG